MRGLRFAGIIAVSTNSGDAIMAEITQDQFDELKDRLEALHQFVMAHVIAADTLNRTLGDDTVVIARERRRLLARKHPRASIFLDMYIEEFAGSRLPDGMVPD